jgi:hypothetical protein
MIVMSTGVASKGNSGAIGIGSGGAASLEEVKLFMLQSDQAIVDSGSGGNLVVRAGQSSGKTGGVLSLSSGFGSTTGGDAMIQTDQGSTGLSGAMTLSTGSGGSGNSGAVTIVSGVAVKRRAGSISVTVGSGNSGTGGALTLSAGIDFHQYWRSSGQSSGSLLLKTVDSGSSGISGMIVGVLDFR